MAPSQDSSKIAEILADLEAVCSHAAAGMSNDPELVRRVTERSRLIREEVLRECGVVDVAVDLVREARNEE
jgi:hypothetical protein